MAQIKKLIPLEDYVYLNRKGFPCSRSWKHRLVKKEIEEGKKAPFKFEIRKDKTYIILK